MLRKASRCRLAAIIVAAFIQTAVFTSSSQAAFILTLNDSTTAGPNVVIIDDDVVLDGNLDTGVIEFSGSLSGTVWKYNYTIGFSKPVLSHPDKPKVRKMDLFSVNVSSDGPGELLITLTDTDFMLPQSDRWNFKHLIGGTTDGTVTADAFIDLDNMESGMGLTPGTLGPFGPGAFSDTAGLQIDDPDATDPFSMTQKVTIVHTDDGKNITSFDSELIVTAPEPGTIAMFGVGLAVLGYAQRRRAA